VNFWFGTELLFLGAGLSFILVFLYSSFYNEIYQEDRIFLLLGVGLFSLGLIKNLLSNLRTHSVLIYANKKRKISHYAALALKPDILSYLLIRDLHILGEIPQGEVKYESPNLEAWMLNHSLHRFDGPAIISRNSSTKNKHNVYFIDGIFHLEEQYWKIINEVKQLPPALRLTDPRWWVREIK
jgi:hypothetical protein